MAEASALELLGTPGCHLCDEAEKLLQTAARARGFGWRYVDIATDDGLLATYGERIPVLRAGVDEIGWPFSLLDVLRLVERSQPRRGPA